MVKYENDCVDCGLPCHGSACSLRRVPHFYCDECHEESDTFHFDGQELCLGCIEQRLDKVEAE